MSDATNLIDTVAPKSDQLNTFDLLSGGRIIKIKSVSRGSAEQPVRVGFDGDNGRPFFPCKSMRRVLIHAWGDDGRQWVGKSISLYCDPSVSYGGVKVGGIRIDALSHINKAIEVILTVRRGVRVPLQIKQIKIAPPANYPDDAFNEQLPRMIAAIASGKSTLEQVIAHLEKSGKLTAAQKFKLSTPQTLAE